VRLQEGYEVYERRPLWLCAGHSIVLSLVLILIIVLLGPIDTPLTTWSLVAFVAALTAYKLTFRTVYRVLLAEGEIRFETAVNPMSVEPKDVEWIRAGPYCASVKVRGHAAPYFLGSMLEDYPDLIAKLRDLTEPAAVTG
jgi:hypothetical protein